MSDNNKTIELLERIVANQEIQLERQEKALDIQQKLFAMQEETMSRAERLQSRAEGIQDKAGAMLKFVFVLIFLLLAYLATLFI